MRPYFLVFYNAVRNKLLKLKCDNFNARKVQMFGWNTRIVIGKTSRVTLGDRIVSDGRMVMMIDEKAALEIGDKVYFNEGAVISCKGLVSIGKNCKFGPNVKIFDNNHKFDAVNGVSDSHSIGSVEIGENCWIASNAVILKGAKIGANSVVGAGCVIDCEIPEKSIVKQGRELVILPMRE